MKRLSYITLYRLRQEVRTARHTSDTISVRSLIGPEVYHYSRAKLTAHRTEIAALLSQVTDTIKQSTGHPDYWIRARYDWQGREWVTDLSDADQLLAIGRAIGFVSVTMPADPASCDIPLVLILDQDAANAERSRHQAERNRRLSAWSYGYLRTPLSTR